MSSSRAVRHLSTAAATAAAASGSSTSSVISISKAKSKLKTIHDPDKALEIYSSVSPHYDSPLATRYAQEYTVRRLAKSHRFSDIETFLESHKSHTKIIEEPFLCSLIRSYGIAGMLDQALNTYNQMDDLGTPRSSVSFNALLSACNASKCFSRVPELFDDIPKRYGFLPDKVTYGILIKAYCEMGSPESAMERLEEMKEKGVEITAIASTTILHSLYKQGKNDEAEKIWSNMVSSGCLLDVGAYNVRIMHVHCENPEKIKGLIEEMINVGLKPDTITYNYLMSAYAANGMIDEAEQVYKDLEGNGCKPNAATFRTLIFNLCQKGRFETGHKVFKESVKVHKIPDFNTLKYLVEGLVKKSKTKEAKGMIRTVKKKFPPNVVKAWEKLQAELGLINLDNNGDEVKTISHKE